MFRIFTVPRVHLYVSNIFSVKNVSIEYNIQFAIRSAKHILPVESLKIMYYSLIGSRALTFDIQYVIHI